MPRPRDATKILIAPVSYVVSAATVGSFSRLGDFVLLWLILEFLIYYARYQWNDILGAVNDRVHPARRLRARLPVGSSREEGRRNSRVSLAAAVVRMLIAFALGVALGMTEAVALMAAAVWSVALLYETLRRPPSELPSRNSRKREVGVWLTVGLGYPVRAGLGFALSGMVFGGAMIAGLAFSFAFGTMYALLNWALEASSFCAQTQGRWIVAAGLRRKPHIHALMPYLEGRPSAGLAPTSGPESIPPATPGYLGATRALNACRDLDCPWNTAFVAGATLSGLLGLELTGLPPTPTVMAMLLCLGGSVGLCRSPRPLVRASVLTGVGVALALLAMATTTEPAWSAALPWLAIAWSYTNLRSRSYFELMGSQPRSSPG